MGKWTTRQGAILSITRYRMIKKSRTTTCGLIMKFIDKAIDKDSKQEIERSYLWKPGVAIEEWGKL